ncbi:integumentary mucin C.1-like [Coregonus clupeaformis]|uniref:integumentary mucin C.1-like n=1 Tax=Coregonus clupeaformis TaxID=59861 RepID=UPI001E1C6CEE|nr:integumentary mucin C.1-like [Coregonus clupeaformis]
MEFRLTGNETAPNANSVKDVLVAAVNSGNLSIRVNASSITVSVQVTPTAAPTTTTGANSTTTAANTTTTGAPTTTTAAVASTTTNFFLLVFSSDEIFASNLSDNSSVVFSDRATKTKNEIEPFYRKAFKSFIQLFVLKFTRGSIITDCRMEFRLTGNGTAPNANSVKDVLVAAVNSGNLSIRVNASSITVSVQVTPTAAPTTTTGANSTTTAANTTTTGAPTTTTAAVASTTTNFFSSGVQFR